MTKSIARVGISSAHRAWEIVQQGEEAAVRQHTQRDSHSGLDPGGTEDGAEQYVRVSWENITGGAQPVLPSYLQVAGAARTTEGMMGGNEVAVASQPENPGRAVQSDARVRAAWSHRAEQIAAQVMGEIKATGVTGDAAIAVAVERILEMPEAQGAKISLCVRDLAGSRSEIASHHQDQALNPASNSKLATATFALGVLGPDYVFKTPFKQDKAGHLYVEGSFDPSLTSQDLLAVAQQLKAGGIDHIPGDLVLDNTRFVGERMPAHFEEYGDQDWDYLARPEALSVDKNLLTMEVQPGDSSGMSAKLKSSQSVFELRCNVMTVEAGQKFKVGCDEQDVAGELVRNSSGQAIVDVWGDIAADHTKGKQLVMKSPDPVASFGDRMVWALEQAGISFSGNIRNDKTPVDARVLCEHHSEPLAELIQKSVSTSNAFDHEMYSLAAAAALQPDGRISIQHSMVSLHHFLAQEIGLTDFRMSNASGIGDANRLSGRDMVDILRNAKANERYHVLLDSLARPGERGTLRTRMLDSPAEGRLYAKTGTLQNAVALSGYIKTDEGSERAFSCLINDYQRGRAGARSVLDALGTVLSSIP